MDGLSAQSGGRARRLVFASVVLGSLVAALLHGPLPQDPAYHVFADTRTAFGIPNALDVLSNIAFMLVGAWGTVVVLRTLRSATDRPLYLQYLLFFFGVFLTGFGSAYYHLAPDNNTLVWDRLPMAVAFMALFASVVSETVDRKLGSFLFLPLVAAGLGSVVFWAMTEQAGRGDLRPYALVQFLPLLLMPLMLLLYKPERNYARGLWSLIGLYGMSKGFELLDRQLHTAIGVSGHTVKHLVAALAAGALVRMLAGRMGEQLK